MPGPDGLCARLCRSISPRQGESMTQNLLNKTTATKENAPHRGGAGYLSRPQVGRTSQHEPRGRVVARDANLVPVEDGRFYHTLGNSRRHLKNLRRDPHATLCVDVDPRLEGWPAGGYQIGRVLRPCRDRRGTRSWSGRSPTGSCSAISDPRRRSSRRRSGSKAERLSSSLRYGGSRGTRAKADRRQGWIGSLKHSFALRPRERTAWSSPTSAQRDPPGEQEVSPVDRGRIYGLCSRIAA